MLSAAGVTFKKLQTNVTELNLCFIPEEDK
jgi:hypothetical protein